MTNADVLRMVKAGLADSTILLSIQRGPVQFDTSPSALVELKTGGVSSAVMDAMLKASPTSRSDKPNPVNTSASSQSPSPWLPRANEQNPPAGDVALPGITAVPIPSLPKKGFLNGRITGRKFFLLYTPSVLLGLAVKFDLFSDPWDGIVALLYLASLLVAVLAAIRRSHDIGHSGWFSLICLIPFVGWYLVFKQGNQGTNRYGPSPLAQRARAAAPGQTS